MNEIRDIVNAMALIGIPSMFACTVWIAKKMISFGKQLRILMDAQQKQMRRDLTQDYHQYMNQGYITDKDLELYEAEYHAYHELGANGVIDYQRNDLIRLNGENNGQEQK